MAAPIFVTRSYGGGAEPAQLVETIGPSDTSFAISTTTGWTEGDGSPLGTVGPFVVIIDRFLDTVEKILCSAVNLTTGLVTVYTSGGFSGRGYDGTTAQGHSPGTTQSGVQTTWSSVEAAEANETVTYVLGTKGGTRTPGLVFTLDGSGNPIWTSIGELSGNPSARIHFATPQSLATGGAKLTSSTTDFTLGGMTVASDAIVVPVDGSYRFSGGLYWPSNTNTAVYGGGILINGSAPGAGGAAANIPFGSGPAYPFVVSFADEMELNASDAVALFAYHTVGGPASNDANSWLAVSLSSQTS